MHCGVQTRGSLVGVSQILLRLNSLKVVWLVLGQYAMEVVEKKCCSVEITVSTNGGRCEGKSIEGVVDDRKVVAWVHCGDPRIKTIAIAALIFFI